ncbi:hypothetical protein [Longimicrobium terrae]|uniref:Uncharacterized protein n=1 Tax=Longimicrobium terrae TaxID=1639882 RepID=A0A841H4C6_9BACT|nr:hypothetical protein [Longimicrobium terrae]MBB4638836.1 hypothetical protein [Longimicrobium terrae]MBB6073075.1 hypothetical protein [Longimicrobium terrae]NNC30233.1 hypothetical protein [Longimicrobium terrae]
MITIDDRETLCLVGHVARESGLCRTEALRAALRLKVHAARNTAAYLDRREEEWRRARVRGEPAPPALSPAERAERMEYGAPLHRHFPDLVPCRDPVEPCGCVWNLEDEEIQALLAEVACGMSAEPGDALRTVLRDRAVVLRRTADALATIGSTERGVRAHMLGEVVCITVDTAPEPRPFQDPALEEIAREVAREMGADKLPEIRQALLVCPEQARDIADSLLWMERNIWSKLPPGVRGTIISKEEREEILGYGPDGY